jgi:glycosyltransferase involved in cell wall biosynthesis
MKVFLSVASLDSRYGGPAFSVMHLANALAKKNLDVCLWAADRSRPNTINLDELHPQLQLPVGSLDAALAQFGIPDIFHDNGIWWAHNRHIARRSQKFGIPRLVSLRGMIEPWALQHKRWKKFWAWHLYQHRHLQMATCFHGTALKEAEHARKLGLSPHCFTIPNGVDIPSVPTISRLVDRSKPLTALFVGRLHPVKGLEPLIEAWSQVRPQGWQVKIAGPDENNYQAQLQTTIDRHSLNAQFEFLGLVDPTQKKALLEQADLLIQPSYTENFGMAIAEALAHGVPVLTTTGTPWAQIAEAGCGWWVAPTVPSFVTTLAQATTIDRVELARMGQIGKSLITDNYSWTSVANCFLDVYQQMLTADPLPKTKT